MVGESDAQRARTKTAHVHAHEAAAVTAATKGDFLAPHLSWHAFGYRPRSNRHRKHQTAATKGVSRTSPGQDSKGSKRNDANKSFDE